MINVPISHRNPSLHPLLPLLFLSLALQALSHELPLPNNASTVCVPPKSVILLNTSLSNCPCHLRAFASTAASYPDLTFSLYAIPLSSYHWWIRAARRAISSNYELPPPPTGALALLSEPLTRYNPILRSHGWSTPDLLDLPARGSYVAVIALSSRSTLTLCARIALTLEPTRCATLSDVYASNALSPGIAEITTQRGRCAGALIAPRWIITSGSCSVSANDVVRIGKREKGTIINVRTHRTGSLSLLHLQEQPQNARPIPIADTRPRTAALRIVGFPRWRDEVAAAVVSGAVALEPATCRERLTKRGRSRDARALDARRTLCVWRDPQCTSAPLCGGAPVLTRAWTGSELAVVALAPAGVSNNACERMMGVNIMARIAPYIRWIGAITNDSVRVARWSPVLASPTPPAIKSTRGFPAWAALVMGAVVAFLVLIAALRLCVVGSEKRKVETEPLSPLSEGRRALELMRNGDTTGLPPPLSPPLPPARRDEFGAPVSARRAQ